MAACFAVCRGVLLLGPRLGYSDRPDGALKDHTQPAVPLGGIGVFVGMLAGLAALGRLDAGWGASTGLLLVLGLLDDRMSLPPVVRLVGEAAAGLALGLSEAMPAGFRSLVGVVSVVVSVVVLVNAVNLIDGIDQLAGAMTFLTAVGLGVLSRGRLVGDPSSFVLAGALLGFLWWNRHPAKLFLGDNGAYLIGGTLAWLATREQTGPGWAWMIALACGGLILFDLAVTLLRRLRAGRRLFLGDRSHLYDQLRDRGWSVNRVVGVLAVAQAAWIALVLAADRRLTPPATFTMLVGGAIIALVVVGRLGFLAVRR
jgi:UDP-GlcNAc:undecaprenyl-phosphate GlcNAc-1-phosphate transferase